MRNASECLDKAAELEALASRYGAPAVSADFHHMADLWRAVACQAVWQDALRTAYLAGQ